MATTVAVLRAALAHLPDDARIAVGDDGLTLQTCERDELGQEDPSWYLELGTVPESRRRPVDGYPDAIRDTTHDRVG